ncbi:alpha/beta hydrolase-fold protein [Spongiivirga sp. MCCC 1A20706]|uniref:alpha/beta hydrolase-fold protein n=1 Tax=Spongiivirga sp. MCCC 1A20706 TaxID=3160963 RepID=UPI003977E103
MKTKILFFTFLLFCCFTVNAQINTESNIVGSTILIKSNVLNQEREIQVFLPKSYSSSEKKFPVLYILDGQRYFLHGVSLQKTFVEFKQSPEFIIVGISKLSSDRNRNYSANSMNYLNFIKNEVIEYIDSQYRTSKNRMLFGWAYAGGFVLETMVTEPNLFDSYIAASPFPLHQKVDKVDSLLRKNTTFSKLLCFTSETNEGVVKEGTRELNKLLSEKAPNTFNWSFEELQGEEHRSTPFTTLYRGLKRHFDFYPELQFNSLEEFIKAGGLNFVYDYYKKRALKYGFSSDLSDWTMFSITRNAMRANSLEQFEKLVNEFKPTGYIKRLRENRACSIAEFYLEHKQFAKAKELFFEITEKNPNSVRALNGIGNTYKGENNERMSKKYFRKAQDISKSNQ